MGKDAVLRWVARGLGAVSLALAVALIVLEPIVGLFALAGAVIGLAIRFFWSRSESREEVPGLPEPAEDAGARGRIVALVIGGASIVVSIATFASLTLLGGEAGDPAPSARVVLRVPYVAELSYTDRGQWEGVETLMLDRPDVAAVLRGRRGPSGDRLRRVLPSPWRLLRSERGDEETRYVFGREAQPVLFDAPGWRPLTASHTIPAPSIRSPLLDAQLVAAEGSRIVLRAPERRVWGTTPASEATADEREDWERREVPLRVGGVAAAGEDVVVEVRSDLARQEFFPQGLVGASAWGGLKWAFSILGLGAVLSSKVREFLWRWVKRLLGRDRKPSPVRRRPRRRR